MHHLHTLPHAKPTARILGEEAHRDAQRDELAAHYAELAAQLAVPSEQVVKIEPITGREANNPLRPKRLDDVVGQDKLKPLLRRLIDSSRRTGQPLDHMLFVGASGTGKTTMATVLANEIGTRVFALKAPLDMGVLNGLREAARDGDVVFVDEIHMQVSGDRRGITQACDPESFYLLLEDGVLATPTGPQPFPRVTWIGATTDVGLLPEPLSNRFPIQPRLDAYTTANMERIATANAEALGLLCEPGVCELFAGASRCIPRQVNNYMRAARPLSDGYVTIELAREVVEDLNGTTLDGLTASMQSVLKFLYQHCGRPAREGVVYKASVNALASAAGHGRDTKAIALLVEPDLIRWGFLSITPGGRQLTDAGIQRAKALVAQSA